MLYSIIMRIFAMLSKYLRYLFKPRCQVDEQNVEREIVITGPRDVLVFSEKPSPEQIAVQFGEVASRLPFQLLTTDLLQEVGPAGSHALRKRLITLGLPEAEAIEAVCEVLVTLVKLRLSRGYVTDIGDIVKYFSETQTVDGTWITRKVIIPAHIQKPITDADLGDAESRMQVHLPRLFRRLYAEVGNGGFGPGYGLVTLAKIIEEYQQQLSIYNACDEDAIELSWPEGLIYLGTEGCTYNFFLDCRDPRYRVIMFSDSHYQERLEEGMLLLSTTFDDWIGHWAMPDWASECFATAHAVGDVSFPAQ
ncbi:MAG: SMI1 / KNR4 family protein [bacterium ADurb.Bin429]|nr:MAG: SMI1 / KNR4 family protein [bacterium ADurb.Bin429]